MTAESEEGLLVLAIDDEQAGLDELVYQLEKNPRVRRVLGANDAAEALRLIGSDDAELVARKNSGDGTIDAAFIDINMPGLSGVELGRVFDSFVPPPSLVFVTGIPDEAVAAFDLGAVDYVLKPLTAERMDKAISRVLADRARVKAESRAVDSAGDGQQPQRPGDDEVIPVELAGTTKLVSRSTVRWVEAQGDYARLHTTDGSHLVRIPLAQLEERWSDAGFVRIHRSYLVSLPLITELSMGTSGYTVVIGDDEKRLPVSRRHTRALKDRLVRAPRTGWEQAP